MIPDCRNCSFCHSLDMRGTMLLASGPLKAVGKGTSMTSHSVWIGVGGNAAIPQGGAAQVPVVGEQANEAFGWGQEFQLGTNLNDTTLQDAINNSHVFHFAPSIPSAISNLENDSGYSRAKILGVGIQAIFTNARLVWLDV